MPLHRIVSMRLAVPNVDAVAAYYEDFGLIRDGYRFSTTYGGEQLILEYGPRRQATEIVLGVDYPDDLDRIASQLAKIEVKSSRTEDSISVYDPPCDVTFTARIAPHIAPPIILPPEYNSPGRTPRINVRAFALDRTNKVRPRKLGHVVLGSTDYAASQRVLVEGFGFKISDVIADTAAFMRCSTDHHNVLVQKAPIPFLHHSSWQLDDVDEVGRAATAMLQKDESRQAWGMGRHYIGANFFWYLRDPAGNFSEYYSDMDCVVDDQLWNPGVWALTDQWATWFWGPTVPHTFVAPEDIVGHMTGAHSEG